MFDISFNFFSLSLFYFYILLFHVFILPFIYLFVYFAVVYIFSLIIFTLELSIHFLHPFCPFCIIHFYILLDFLISMTSFSRTIVIFLLTFTYYNYASDPVFKVTWFGRSQNTRISVEVSLGQQSSTQEISIREHMFFFSRKRRIWNRKKY